MNAAGRWRAALDARAIPQALIDAAPASPWGFPRDLFVARAADPAGTDPAVSPTTARALEALPEGGSVLDVGVGGGATSLPMAARAAVIVGVDAQPDMIGAFASTGAGAGVRTEGVLGTWPDIEADVPSSDVVVSGHTVYNVADLGPFVLALDAHARRRVVIEATARHPLGWMADLWQRFHGLDMPDEPAIELAIELIGDLGIQPRRQDRAAGDDDPAGGGFDTREAAVALVRTRLCLRPDDDEAVGEALGNRLRTRHGRWSAGPLQRTVVTLWWDR